MSLLNSQSIVQRNPDLIAAEAGADLVMVSIENGHYYGLSNVAKHIWGAIEQPVTVVDLVDQLRKIYSVDSDVCEKETLEFLEQLWTERLIQVRNAWAD